LFGPAYIGLSKIWVEPRQAKMISDSNFVIPTYTFHLVFTYQAIIIVKNVLSEKNTLTERQPWLYV
jgi:hypothetical protein